MSEPGDNPKLAKGSEDILASSWSRVYELDLLIEICQRKRDRLVAELTRAGHLSSGSSGS